MHDIPVKKEGVIGKCFLAVLVHNQDEKRVMYNGNSGGKYHNIGKLPERFYVVIETKATYSQRPLQAFEPNDYLGCMFLKNKMTLVMPFQIIPVTITKILPSSLSCTYTYIEIGKYWPMVMFSVPLQVIRILILLLIIDLQFPKKEKSARFIGNLTK